MGAIPETLLVLGGLLLLGLLAEVAARRTRLPRVTLLLLLGVLAGPAGLDVLPAEGSGWFDVVAELALVMIGFLLGGEFTLDHLREVGRSVFVIAGAQSVTTVAVVGAGLLLAGASARLALPLAGVAAATAPAATLAVVRETGARGRFTSVLKGVVAVDDAIGIVLFSLLLAAAGLLSGGGLDPGSLLLPLREIGGAAALGLLLGAGAAPLTGRLRTGEATLEEALGLILVCGGLAMWLEVSSILAAMVMGGTLANLARHHERPFHEIENIEWPFLVVFFLLAGASLELGVLSAAGPVVLGYVLLRTTGKTVGAALGTRLARSHLPAGRWLGLALMPQAGVALGLAIAASRRFPASEAELLNVVVAATVVFELAGPVLTRLALRSAGEIPDRVAEGEGP